MMARQASLRQEQMRTFVSQPTPEFRATVQALQAYPDPRRAYAQATHTDELVSWLQHEGLTPASGHACLARLLGKRCDQYSFFRARREVPCALPGADHTTLWLKDGIPEVYVTQPYFLDDETMGAIGALCARWGLRCMVSTWPAWHFPGGVLSILVRRHPDTPAPTRKKPATIRPSTAPRIIPAAFCTTTLEDIQAHGFMVSKGAQRGLRNRWSRRCESTGAPVIHVKLARRYATIEVDLEMTGRQWVESWTDQFSAILHRLEGPPRQCGYMGGPQHALFHHVPNDQAVMVAQTILALYQQDGMTERDTRHEAWDLPRAPRDSEHATLEEWSQTVDALVREVERKEADTEPPGPPRGVR